jgi:DMSO reductase anchor subunit
MKLTPFKLFLFVLLAGAVLFIGSAMLSFLGDAASQRSDVGIVAGAVLVLVAAGGLAAGTLHLIQQSHDPGKDKPKDKDTP